MDCRELECLIYIITIISYLNYRGIRAHQMYHNDEVKVIPSNRFILQEQNRKIRMDGGQGYRSLYLAHAKRALCHLS